MLLALWYYAIRIYIDFHDDIMHNYRSTYL